VLVKREPVTDAPSKKCLLHLPSASSMQKVMFGQLYIPHRLCITAATGRDWKIYSPLIGQERRRDRARTEISSPRDSRTARPRTGRRFRSADRYFVLVRLQPADQLQRNSWLARVLGQEQHRTHAWHGISLIPEKPPPLPEIHHNVRFRERSKTIRLSFGARAGPAVSARLAFGEV
jgi:hypothetical protein